MLRKPSNTITYCLIMIAVFALCICATSCGSSDSSSDNPDKIEAYVMSQEFVKERLKAPATADFPWYDENFVKELGDNKFEVNAYVDAENSFGAKVRTNYSCVLKYVGDDKWRAESVKLHE